MNKIDEKYIANIMIILVSFVFYFLSLNAIISFFFNKNVVLEWYDYLIEIVAFAILGTLLIVNKKKIVEKLF